MNDSDFCLLSGDSYSFGVPKGIESKVYEQLRQSTVKVLHGQRFGSGIVLDQQEHVVTDGHVAGSAPSATRKFGKALAAIHANPQDQWQVVSLAQHVGMSRSRFVCKV